MSTPVPPISQPVNPSANPTVTKKPTSRVNSSTAAIMALAAALTAGGGATVVTSQVAQKAAVPITAVVKGPSTSPVGKLVTLTVEAPGATQVRWYPEQDGISHVCDDGRSVTMTQDKPGVVELAVFVANSETSAVVVHKVVFGSPPNSPGTPKPPGGECPPCPPPPVPVPGPTPIPVPVPIPTPVSYGLAQAVPTWLTKVTPATAQKQAPNIGGAYATVADKASSGAFTDLDQVDKACGEEIVKLFKAGKLDAVAWKPFGESVNGAFTALKAIGRITTPKEYGQALTEVANALK
jgi:hypothetical protein